MAGLLDFVNTPQGQGLLAAAFGGLAGARRGQPINSLGRAGLAGLAGYSGAQDRALQEAQVAEVNKYRNMQTAAMQAQMDAAKAKTDQEAAKRNALPGLFGGQTVGGGTTTPEVAGIPMFSQGSTVQPTRTVGAGKLDVQAALRAGYTPEEIVKMSELSNVGKPKVARTIKAVENGREVEIQLDELGQRVGEGFQQYRAPIQINQGDRQTFVDPFSFQTAGSFGINQSPDSKASNAIAIRGQNMADGRARERLAFDRAGGADGATGGKAPTGYRWNADRTALEPIPGGPANKADNATEGERKAGTLLARLEGSLGQLEAVTAKNPSAASPNVLAEAARGIPLIGGATPANAIMSGDRQRVEAAQLDILDAALTLGTGAAYTREQLEGYRRSYFPQVMDSKATIKDKQDRLDNVLEAARIAAGRSGPQVARRPVSPSSDAKSTEFKIISVEGGN